MRNLDVIELPYFPILPLTDDHRTALNKVLIDPHTACDQSIIGIRTDARPDGTISTNCVKCQQGVTCLTRISDLPLEAQTSASLMLMDSLTNDIWKARISQVISLIGPCDGQFWALYLRSGIFVYPKDFIRSPHRMASENATPFKGGCMLGWTKESAHQQITEMHNIAPVASWLRQSVMPYLGDAVFKLCEVPDA